eukprot:3032506-Lingulodinium_polyedra.AAC.1
MHLLARGWLQGPSAVARAVPAQAPPFWQERAVAGIVQRGLGGPDVRRRNQGSGSPCMDSSGVKDGAARNQGAVPPGGCDLVSPWAVSATTRTTGHSARGH